MFRWELEDLAREQLAGMPPRVQLALSDFMDAVVIVDPAEYQRRPDEPERPLRTLCRSEIRFGPLTCGFSVSQAACAYSLIRPPRTGLRWIRAVSRSVTVARGVSRSAPGTC